MSTETAPAEVTEELSPAQQDAAQSIATQAPTPATDAPEPATTDEPKGDKPEFPKMVPVTALQAERQRRQQEAAGRREEAQARAALEARIAQLEGRAPQGATGDPLAKPRPEDFQTREAYDNALDVWSDRKAEAKVATKAQEDRLRNTVETFWNRANEVSKEIPQIGHAIESFIQMEADFHPDVYADIVGDKQDGPRIVWEIASDLDFAQKLMRATPLQAGRLIDQRLASAQKPKTPERPQVTATTTVSGAGSASKDPSQMSTAEYIAWREKQEN